MNTWSEIPRRWSVNGLTVGRRIVFERIHAREPRKLGPRQHEQATAVTGIRVHPSSQDPTRPPEASP